MEGLTVIRSMLLATVLILTGCSASAGLSVSPVPVRYYVPSDDRATVSLTYQNALGDTEQIVSVRTPWEQSYEIVPGSFVQLSAQNGEADTAIKCEIFVGGRVFETATSDGPFQIATCSGQVPHLPFPR